MLAAAWLAGQSGPGSPQRDWPALAAVLIAALSRCHILQYLHQCADAGVVMTGRANHGHGIMTGTGDSNGSPTKELAMRRQQTMDSGARD